MTYNEATQILEDCAEGSCQGEKNGEVKMGNGKEIKVCTDCWNRHVYARRAARKEHLAKRPKDCARCAKRTHTFIYAGHRLCGRCKTQTAREQAAGMAKLGDLTILASLSGATLFETKDWKGLQATKEAGQ